MKFITLESPAGRRVVPATSIGSIVLDRDGRHANVLGQKGDVLGWVWAEEALALAEDVTIVPAAPGWLLITAYDANEGTALQPEPVIAWRIDRSASAGGVVPVTASWETNGAVHDGEPYVVVPPEGVPTDNHCTLLGGRSDEALRQHLARLRRGRAAAQAPPLAKLELKRAA